MRRLLERLETRTLLAYDPIATNVLPTTDAGGVNPRGLGPLGDGVIFAADTAGGLGRELWYSDGTVVGTRLVIDIADGSGSSEPIHRFAASAGYALFQATSTTRGTGLYSTFGTGKRTKLILPSIDLPSLGGTAESRAATAFGEQFVEHKGFTYLTLRTAPNTFELWRTVGTPEGTSRLAGNIVDVEDSPGEFAVAGDWLYFISEDSPDGDYQFWLTDGTAKNTKQFPVSIPGKLSMWTQNGRLFASSFESSNQKITGTVYELSLDARKTLSKRQTTDVVFGTVGTWPERAAGVNVYPREDVLRVARFDGTTALTYGSGELFNADVTDYHESLATSRGDFIFTKRFGSVSVLKHDGSTVQLLSPEPIKELVALERGGGNWGATYAAGSGTSGGGDRFTIVTLNTAENLSLQAVDFGGSREPMLISSDAGRTYISKKGKRIVDVASTMTARGVFFTRVEPQTQQLALSVRASDKTPTTWLTGPAASAPPAPGKPYRIATNGTNYLVFSRGTDRDAGNYDHLLAEWYAPGQAPVLLRDLGLFGEHKPVSIHIDRNLAYWWRQSSTDVLGNSDGAGGYFRTRLSDGKTIRMRSSEDWSFRTFEGRLKNHPTGMGVFTSAGTKRGQVYFAPDDPAQPSWSVQFTLSRLTKVESRVIPAGPGKWIVAGTGHMFLTDGTQAGTVDLLKDGVLAPTDAEPDRILAGGDLRVLEVAAASTRAIAYVETLEIPNSRHLVDFDLVQRMPTRRAMPNPTYGGVRVDNLGILWAFTTRDGVGQMLRIDPSVQSVVELPLNQLRLFLAVHNGQAFFTGPGSLAPGAPPSTSVFVTDGTYDARAIVNLGAASSVATQPIGRHLLFSAGGGTWLRYADGLVTTAFTAPTGWDETTHLLANDDTLCTVSSTGNRYALSRYTPTLSLAGTVYNDANRNGTQDGNEKGLRGWRVFLDRDGDKVWDKNEQAVRASSSGRYEFYDLPKGTFSVCVTMVEGFTPISSIPVTVKLKKNQSGVIKRIGVAAVL